MSTLESPLMASAPNPSTASSTAVYVPLADANEIRLLHLQPGCGNETIKCSLQNTELPNSPPYEALSYMWGPKVYKTIVLDGKSFSVTQNLWQALIHLRRENDSRTLWVDAVCVNQKDTSERNHQVRQMGIVYNQAWRVLAWLGLADDDSRLAFHVCASYLVNKLPGPYDFLRSLTLSGAKLKAIQSLCSRAYWSRLWIIQELLLAKDILLCCGNEELEWIYFQYVLEHNGTWEGPFRNGQLDKRISTSIPRRLCRYRNKNKYGPPRQKQETTYPPDRNAILGELCSDYAQSECEERKDKIFGLCGITRSCCKDAITIDYSVPWPQICSDVYVHYIQHHSNFNVAKASQYFHRSLKFRSQDFVDSSIELCAAVSDKRKDWTRDFATVRGEISHVFPLSTKPNELSKISLRRCSSHGSFASHVRWQIDLIYKSMWHHRNLASGCHLEHDLDLVAAFPSPPFEAVLVPGKDYRSSTLRPRLSYENAEEPLTLDLLWRLLRSQGADHTSPYAKTCSIAFQADGKIYFVPQKARVGDIICSFSTELCSLVRMDTNSRVGSVLGRCLDFLPPGIRTEVNRPIISLGQIQIQFDLRTLHLQTRVSDRECMEAD